MCRPGRSYQKYYRSTGHVWQGRFKAFPIQEDRRLASGPFVPEVERVGQLFQIGVGGEVGELIQPVLHFAG